ncbi:TAP-like protein [Devosia enhydra]|uniref:Proline iminopeptidase n=1 Tax=Devosia enhydra TaxID=665118 RepID=A0A1K2HXW7_9HYPH|nr:alpha/beta fold hydrolase [Devosia enhydra]SFZ84653.1 TAP-like protein [Devosia enhydra]
MDYVHLMALIASLAGNPAPTGFAELRALAAASGSALALHACVQPIGYDEIEGETVLCGTLTVPENHDLPGGRALGLEFAVLKAKTRFPEADPLVHLHGGPGGGVVDQLAGYAQIFDAWRQTRDIVLFDQRSAGLSDSSVACAQALSAYAPAIMGVPTEAGDGESNAIRDCLGELEAAGVDLKSYNTLQNAYDVRTLVQGLGYSRYNLYGISYGTKLALEVMRSASEGLRAVIIDGVVPMQVAAYDTVAVPADEAVALLVAQCKADAACDAAYPDLGGVITELLDKAVAGTLTKDGAAIPPEAIVQPIIARNGQRGLSSLTPYLPAYVYEIYRGKETPTIDMLSAANFQLPAPGPELPTAAAKALSPGQQKLAAAVIADLGAQIAATGALQQSVWDLEAMVRADRFGPIVELFDRELSAATVALLTADPATGRAQGSAMIVDYVGLLAGAPSRDALLGFVDRHFEGEPRDRLRALVEAMRQSEIEGSFALIGTSSRQAEAGFLRGQHLSIYACQEDIPFNSPEGVAAVNATLDYPGLAEVYASATAGLFAICQFYTPSPRAGDHVAVVSDIPTLAIGSAWDTQTAMSWAATAVETLPNGQSFVVPEAGHGALIYQRCAVEMGVAFINDPARRLEDVCGPALKPSFYMAPWVEADRAPGS